MKLQICTYASLFFFEMRTSKISKLKIDLLFFKMSPFRRPLSMKNKLIETYYFVSLNLLWVLKNRQQRMEDSVAYVSKLQADLRTKLDRLCWTHNEPALHVAEHFAELRSQVDYDAERVLNEIQPNRNEKVDSKEMAKVDRVRVEFIRILQELEKRIGERLSNTKPRAHSIEVYVSMQQRVNAFLDDSSRSLEDLDDLYIQLAREIIAEIDRIEKSYFGEQTIIFLPSKGKNRLGSLVYFGDIFLNPRQVESFM